MMRLRSADEAEAFRRPTTAMRSGRDVEFGAVFVVGENLAPRLHRPLPGVCPGRSADGALEVRHAGVAVLAGDGRERRGQSQERLSALDS